MAHKENKGGFLKPDQIEKDLEAKGKSGQHQTYAGSQDTGDKQVRQMGNEVQQQDGLVDEEDNDGR